jgi:hypothetical protein
MDKYYISDYDFEEYVLCDGIECQANGFIILLDSINEAKIFAIKKMGLIRFTIYKVNEEGINGMMVLVSDAIHGIEHYLLNQMYLEPEYLKLEQHDHIEGPLSYLEWYNYN